MEDTHAEWRVDPNRLLHYKGAIYMPNDPTVKQEIMKMNHDDLYAGHFRVAKTMELICRKYHWLGITQEIKDYVIGCNIC